MSSSLQQRTAGATTRAALLSGSRIQFHGDPKELAERIMLSAGTRPAGGETDPARRYADGTYVPRRPWRQASTAEIRLLDMGRGSAGRHWRASADVAVIRIPDELISPFADMLEQRGLREAADPNTYQTIASHSRWSESLRAIGEYLSGLSDEPPNWIYFRIAEPDRFTLTKDEFGADGRKLAGLHVDSWDGLPLRHRGRSRNRACINLGREPRYLLFFNLPLMEMFTGIGLRDPEDIYQDFRGLYVGHRFMKSWPEYPAIRLRVNPGEAYIFPTDNLIHDASTEGNRYPDISLTYLGRFVPGRHKDRDPCRAGQPV
jgi:hypothetical protein